MTTYKELLQQREALEREIASARQSEIQDGVAKVRALVAEYSLSQDHVFGRANPRKGTAEQKVAPKYRDPATGATWTGRGKPPKWIADKDRSEFAIA